MSHQQQQQAGTQVVAPIAERFLRFKWSSQLLLKCILPSLQPQFLSWSLIHSNHERFIFQNRIGISKGIGWDRRKSIVIWDIHCSKTAFYTVAIIIKPMLVVFRYAVMQARQASAAFGQLQLGSGGGGRQGALLKWRPQKSWVFGPNTQTGKHVVACFLSGAGSCWVVYQNLKFCKIISSFWRGQRTIMFTLNILLFHENYVLRKLLKLELK